MDTIAHAGPVILIIAYGGPGKVVPRVHPQNPAQAYQDLVPTQDSPV